MTSIHTQVLSGKCDKKICVETCALSANTAQHGQDKGNLFVWPVRRLQYLIKSLADSQVLVIYDSFQSPKARLIMCVIVWSLWQQQCYCTTENHRQERYMIFTARKIVAPW